MSAIIDTLKTKVNGEQKEVYPKTVLEAVIDAETGQTLDVILDNIDVDIPSGTAYVDFNETGTDIPGEIEKVTSATTVSYSNATSGLNASNIQEAVDKTNEKIDNLVVSGGSVLYSLEQTETAINLKGSDNSISTVNIDSEISATSTNPVQNKAIAAKFEEVFQSVSNGKEMIASAITDKGVYTENDATFETMATNIGNIRVGGDEIQYNLYFGEEAPEDKTKLWVKTADEIIYSNINGQVPTKTDDFDGTFNSALPDFLTIIPKPVIVENDIYIIGGWGDDSKYYPNIYIYHTLTNDFTILKNIIPTPPTNYYLGCMTSIVDKDIYFTIKGEYLYKFNIDTHNITLLAQQLSLGIDNVKAYVFYNNCFYYTSNKILYKFNIMDYTKTLLLSDFPSLSGTDTAMCLVGDKIYCFGGNVGGNYTIYSNKIYVVDLQTNVITNLRATLLKYANNMSATLFNNYIYLFGGEESTGQGGGYAGYETNDNKTVYKFNIITEEIVDLKVNNPYTSSYSYIPYPIAQVGGNIYILGSYSNSAILKFNTDLIVPYKELLISFCFNKNLFNIISGPAVGLTVGIDGVYKGNQDNIGEKADAYLYKHYNNPKPANYKFTEAISAGDNVTTSLSQSINCNIGDLVIATIMARDAITLSDGWTLISTSNQSVDDTNQTLSFAYKYAEATTETITVTQASEQRLLININAFQGATGFIDNGYVYTNGDDFSQITIPKAEGLVLFAADIVAWGDAAYWETSPVTYIQHAPTMQRLVTALDQSDNTELTFNSIGVGSELIGGSLTILGMDKFYDTITEEWVSIYE